MLDESSVAAFSQLGASFFAAGRARLAEPRADATWMCWRDGGDGEMMWNLLVHPKNEALEPEALFCWRSRKASC